MNGSNNFSFPGQIALVFGGAKGIGKAASLEFARRGALIAVADIDEPAARETANAIIAKGGRAIGLRANVLSEDSIAQTASRAEAELGEIDVVMNNVGAMLNGHPEDIPMAEWQRMMDLNYFSAVRSVKHFLPKFLSRGSGYIVNTASFAGLYPYAASRMPYAATKAAIIALTESLAIYLEPKGIRVSCFIPGPVMTDIMNNMTSWSENCPMRGPGSELDLKDVAETATRLADGMEAGRIMISSDDNVWNLVQKWAESPDRFIRDKIEAFAQGDAGLPRVPEALRRK
jgi:NAD(P)-dependent dehydrogenase (short-subunit alcohol dehydrogenase family)